MILKSTIFVAGPWVVLNRKDHAEALAEKDGSAVEAAERASNMRTGGHLFEYLSLRRAGLRAARSVPREDLPPMGLEYGVQPGGTWLTHPSNSPEAIFEAVREERRQDEETFWDDLKAVGGRDPRPLGWVFDPDAE